jgi:hypothetical protein
MFTSEGTLFFFTFFYVNVEYKMQVSEPYFQNLMLDVKNMRVKHVRRMFVLLRELGTELKLGELQDKKDWSSFQKLNEKLGLLVVEHGLTLGEFATGYVFNIQARQREPTRVIAPPPPATKPVVKRKRKVEGAESSKRKKVE